MYTPREELVGLFPPTFDSDYIDGAVVPYLLSGTYVGERPALPLIDLTLSKENAIPPHFWGVLYDEWAPNPEEGVSVFIQGYEQRGPDNARKKIYLSATTPDLYAAKYAGKVRSFLARLFDEANAGTPLMRKYYEDYFDDLYWDLHLGVTGEGIPPEVRQVRASFIAVIGYWFPTSEIVHESVMRVRELRPLLKEWIAGRVQAVENGDVPDPEGTFGITGSRTAAGERTSAARTSSSRLSTTSWRSVSGATWRRTRVTRASGRGSNARWRRGLMRRTAARSLRSTGS